MRYTEGKVGRILGIPHDFEAVALIPMGFPKREAFIESTEPYNFTGIPRSAKYFFICLIVYFPKCTIEATRTASACPWVMAS